MLALSFKQPQGYSFGSPKMSTPDSSSTGALSQPTLCAPSLTNSTGPRRSLMPQCSRRPKLSLQTSILPQPVSPALPLPCSADTPTTRNTLANSFRSPLPGTEGVPTKSHESQTREISSVPYGPESTRRSILKNTPLAKLIRSRKEEKERKKARHGQARITFLDEPQVIPRSREVELESDEEVDITPHRTGESFDGARSDEMRSGASGSRSDSAEWHRLRDQRSANEGRELRSACRLSSKSTTPTSSSSTEPPRLGMPSPLSRDKSPNRVPETPETPSPRVTRDWVWTLGDDFSPASASTSPAKTATRSQPPQTARCAGKNHSQPALSKLTTVIRRGGALPDTPNTATPVTPMTPVGSATGQPDTPVTPGSATADTAAAGKQAAGAARPSPLNINVALARRPDVKTNNPLTPRSVPLPETPRFARS